MEVNKNYLNNNIKIKENLKIPTLDGLPSKIYRYKGIDFNLDNILTYMEYDYWDIDETKFDFWFRLSSHQTVFNKVLKINGYGINKNIGNDDIEKYKKELEETAKKYPQIELDLNFDWNDE
jgi:hypothetical protein